MNLQFGRNLRIHQIQSKFNLSIKLSECLISEDNNLIFDIVKWLEKSNWLDKIRTQHGLIKDVKDIIDYKEHLMLTYTTYKRNRGLMPFITYLPKKIVLDNSFFYFLGLKLGDGTNGARVGIVNKDYFIVQHSYMFLKKIFPYSQIHLDLRCYKKSHEDLIQRILNKFKSITPSIDIYYSSNSLGNYCFSVYVTNKIFSRVLSCIIEHLKDLFQIATFEQKGAFLAGFFDAEGNVNKIDGNLRFSQKIEKNVKLVSNLLLNEGYHIRYDGSNIVIAHKNKYHNHDLQLFQRQVLQFLVSKTKKKEAIDVINGYLVRDDYKPIVQFVAENPNISQHYISLHINRKKCYAKLQALVKAGYLSMSRLKKNETFKYSATFSGLQWIGG